MDADDWRSIYIAALVDNHAGIVVTVGKDSNRSIGYRIAIECRIKLQSKDSRDLLAEFCDEYDFAYRLKTKKNTTYEAYEIVIGRRNDVRAFLKEVHPYLVVRGDAVALLCDQIIPKMNQGDHQKKASFFELMQDIEQFREQVGRANRAKYDIQHFRNEWDIVGTSTTDTC